MFDQQESRSHILVRGADREHVEPESASAAQAATTRSSGRSISDSVDESLTAIDDLVRGLQATTAAYRDRPLDWSDVVSLRQVREHLGGAVKDFSSADAAAALHRAARQVAIEVSCFRLPLPA